jgi:hypothetical protein
VQAVDSLICSRKLIYISSGSTKSKAYSTWEVVAVNLLRSNDLAGEELRGGVGEVLDIVHDGAGSVTAGSLLEIIHAVPLDGGLDAVRVVGAELDDLWTVRYRPDLGLASERAGHSIPSRT